MTCHNSYSLHTSHFYVCHFDTFSTFFLYFQSSKESFNEEQTYEVNKHK